MTIVFYASITIISIGMFRTVVKYASGLSNNTANRLSIGNFLCCILWFIWVIVATFRPVGAGYGGADAQSYIDFFESGVLTYIQRYELINSLADLLGYREPLFVLLNYVIRLVTDDYRVLFFCVYGIIAFSTIVFSKAFFTKESHLYPFAMAFCTFVYCFNIFRGGLCVSFCMLAFVQLKKKKFCSGAILVFIGAMIHYVGLCFFVVWAIVLISERIKIEFTTRRLLLWSVEANVITFLLSSIIAQFFIGTKYEVYFSEDIVVNILGNIPGIVCCVIAILLYDFEKNNYDHKIVILALFVCLSLKYLSIGLGGWRINDFFILIEMVFFAEIWSNNRRLRIMCGRHDFMKTIICAFFLIRLFQFWHSLYESSSVFPYFGIM